MWRKLQISSSSLRSAALRLLLSRSDVVVGRAVSNPTLATTTFSSRLFSSDADDKVDKSVAKKTVEDVLPIATGHEREEIEAELEGKKRFDMDAPCGPFGTKDWKPFPEAPAVIQSFYDKRIVGCPGGEGDDEHDVVWFWLEKDKPHECPVCSQYFVLEVVGPGGPPDGHGDDDDH